MRPSAWASGGREPGGMGSRGRGGVGFQLVPQQVRRDRRVESA